MTKITTLVIALITFNIGHVLGNDQPECYDHEWRDIIDVCESIPETTGWGKILRDNPVIYEVYASTRDATLFIPSNKALEKYSLRTGEHLYRRSLADDSSQAGYQIGNRLTSIQQSQQQGASVVATADTKTSPGGNPSVLVTKPAGRNVVKKRTKSFNHPDPKPPGITVVSGAGETAEILFGDIISKQGHVHVVDTVFRLPIPATDTLEVTGLTDFRQGVNDACLEDILDNTHQLTIFAPVNEECRNETLCVESYIVLDQAIYSPNLHDGDKYTAMDGTELEVTMKGGEYYINCVRIIHSDLITNNGVVHSLESTFPSHY